MRSVSSAALLGAALIAAVPAVAQQVYDPAGPAYYNSPNPPSTGTPYVYDPAGPAYYNSPPATVSPNPPSYNVPGYVYDPAGPAFYNSPPAMVSPNPPSYNTPPGVYDPAGPAFYNTPSASSPPMVAMPQAAAPQAGAPYAAPQAAMAPSPSFGAQQPGPSVWQNGRWVVMPPRGMQAPQAFNPQRWGGMTGGRWAAGTQAPGGWSAYRRPRRGGSLPAYWMSGSFRIPDFLSFGLAAPPYGYFWTRYYDDAVLVDAGGRVWDSVSGIAWSGASASASAGRGYASAASSASASAGIRQVDPNAYYGQQPAPIPYPSPYPQGGYAPPAAGAPPAVYFQGGCPQVCPGAIYGSYYGGGGGYYSGGGTTTTTVTIQPAPIVTTTTIEEEVTEEEVTTTTTYVSKPRRVVRRAAPVRRYHPKPRRRGCACYCCR